MEIYEILVPTMYGDTRKPISKRHHLKWDEYVRTITGGLTVFKPAKGSWVNVKDKELFVERVIPVKVACTTKQMKEIVTFTIRHYRQIAVMYYKISDNVEIVYA